MECGECDNKPWWAQKNQKNKTMTAEEYIKHYVSGQGGFESVSVDVALRAIEYAKQEMKQQLMKDAVEGEIVKDIANNLYIGKAKVSKNNFKFGDKVKLLVLKEE